LIKRLSLMGSAAGGPGHGISPKRRISILRFQEVVNETAPLIAASLPFICMHVLNEKDFNSSGSFCRIDENILVGMIVKENLMVREYSVERIMSVSHIPVLHRCFERRHKATELPDSLVSSHCSPYSLDKLLSPEIQNSLAFSSS